MRTLYGVLAFLFLCFTLLAVRTGIGVLKQNAPHASTHLTSAVLGVMTVPALILGIAVLWMVAARRHGKRRNTRVVVAASVSTVLLVGLMAWAVLNDEHKPPRGAQPVQPIVWEAASFSEPSGWVRVTPNQPGLIGNFISSETARHPNVAAITILASPPKYPTPRALAEAMIANNGGFIQEAPTNLDGIEAVRFTLPNAGPKRRYMEAMAAQKGIRVFLILAAAAQTPLVMDGLEQVRKSWKWVEPPAAAPPAAGKPEEPAQEHATDSESPGDR